MMLENILDCGKKILSDELYQIILLNIYYKNKNKNYVIKINEVGYNIDRKTITRISYQLAKKGMIETGVGWEKYQEMQISGKITQQGIDYIKYSKSNVKSYMKKESIIQLLILLDIEAKNKVDFSQYDIDTVNHIKFKLYDDGFITGNCLTNDEGNLAINDAKLTTKGYEFLIKTKKINKSNNILKSKVNVMNNSKIFLSYSRKYKTEADKIDDTLQKHNIIVTKDDRDLEYTGNIDEFEESIRNHDKTIILISDEFLTSKNCMNEVVNLLKEKKYKEKILPIIINIEYFEKVETKLNIIKFWESEFKKLESILRENDIQISINFNKEYNKTKNIKNNISDFMDAVQGMLFIKYENTINNDFQELVDIIQKNRIEHEDVDIKYTNLKNIDLIENTKIKRRLNYLKNKVLAENISNYYNKHLYNLREFFLEYDELLDIKDNNDFFNKWLKHYNVTSYNNIDSPFDWDMKRIFELRMDVNKIRC